MKEYKIVIRETLEKEIDVKAKSGKDALKHVEGLYKNGEEVLNWEDFKDVEIEVLKEKGE